MNKEDATRFLTAYRKMSLADLFTLCNAISGFIGITYALDGRYHMVAIFVFVSFIFDGLDGIASRRFASRHGAGKILDSVADAVSFVMLPALLIYTSCYDMSRGTAFQDRENALVVISSLAILGAGLVRLGIFTTVESKRPYFAGLPTPMVSLIIVQAYFLVSSWELELLALLLAIGMISPLPIMKVRGRLYPLAMLATIPLLIYSIAFLRGQDLPILLVVGILAISVYIIASPFYLLHLRMKEKQLSK